MSFDLVSWTGAALEWLGRVLATALQMQAEAGDSYRRRNCPPGPSPTARSARGKRLQTLSCHRVAAAAPALLRAWACVATLGLAALLAPVSASAQLSTTVTAGVSVLFEDSTFFESRTGYSRAEIDPGPGYGSIDPASFIYGGETYTVYSLYSSFVQDHDPDFGYTERGFYIAFNSELPAALDTLVLSSGSVELAFSEVTSSYNTTQNGYYYYWTIGTASDNPFDGVDAGDEVEFELRFPGATNIAPAFADSTLTRTLAENTAADTDIGDPVTATDTEGDALSYSLQGTDADAFTIDSSTGQIKTKTGVSYNYETKASYAITVKADDGNGGTDTVAVTVNLTDVDEPPSAPAAPSVTGTPGDTTLTVAWSTPANTGPPITGYDLQLRQDTTEAFADGPQDVVSNRATITVNAFSTAYQVRVRASNDEGDSDWSPLGTGRTGDPPPSDDATLSSLVLNRYPPSDPPQQLVALDPPFHPDTTNYRAATPVPAMESIVHVVVTPNNLDATVAITRDNALSTPNEAAIGLSPGENTITVTVTAEDDANTRIYTVTVEREQYPPSLPGESRYSILPENTAAGTDVGAPVTATDREGDPLTYTLEGTDANAFTLHVGSASAQIRTKTGVSYDYEDGKRRYEFTVMVDDGNGGTDRMAVTVDIADVDEQSGRPAAPLVSGGSRRLDVSWTKPDENGGPQISNYEVQYRPGTSGQWLDHLHESASTDALTLGLLRGTKYQVRVRAQNGEIDSEWSDPGSATTRNEGVALSTASLVIPEGGRATYTVVLLLRPTGPVTVTLAVSGDPDVKVSPSSLTFTAVTWNRPQTVTVSTAHDENAINDAAVVSHQVTGADYFGVTVDDVQITVDDDEVFYGTIEPSFQAVYESEVNGTVTGGPLPDIHFGRSFELLVRFRLNGDYVQLAPGPENWIRAGGALQVTGADVDFIPTHYSRVRLALTPRGREDVMVRVQPMTCPDEKAMCSRSNGLSRPLTLTVRGVSGPPEAPQHVTVDVIDYNENGQPDLSVSFDLDPVGTDYRIQYQRAGLAWGSYGEETSTRGQRRYPGRDTDVVFDVAEGQGYDVRVRWENPNGAGPWTTVDNDGDAPPDVTPPRLLQRTVNGNTLVLTYDETLDDASVPAPGDFVVAAAGNTINVTQVSVDGSRVTLTLAAPVQPNQAVSIDYTPGANPIQDASGNDAAPLSGTDVRPPQLTRATVNASRLVLTYDETLDAASVPAPGDFVVTAAGSTARCRRRARGRLGGDADAGRARAGEPDGDARLHAGREPDPGHGGERRGGALRAARDQQHSGKRRRRRRWRWWRWPLGAGRARVADDDTGG